MKFYGLILPLLLAGAQAQTARQQYAATCPNKDGQTEEIIPGYTVKYSCESRKIGVAHQNVASLQDCARMCQDEEGCTGSSWSARKICVLAGTGELLPQAKAVFMERILNPNPSEGPENPFDFNCETENSQIEELEQQISELQEDLAACQTAGFDGGSPAIEVLHPDTRCTDVGGSIQQGGQTWDIHCSNYLRKNGATSEQVPQVQKWTDCLNICSARADCLAGQYLSNTKVCEIVTSTGVGHGPGTYGTVFIRRG